ncbi:hypothetical protein VP01_3789g2 [Puccinia sorghi]|uniref:Uncharacterized protein n=1 Tax=Puccinia sorghi TaxID=27349 RepID=A0A0L6UTQ1_9BASI|nr:hypothetical protein VP01_3789g2 [Puccinia sorghi]
MPQWFLNQNNAQFIVSVSLPGFSLVTNPFFRRILFEIFLYMCGSSLAKVRRAFWRQRVTKAAPQLERGSNAKTQLKVTHGEAGTCTCPKTCLLEQKGQSRHPDRKRQELATERQKAPLISLPSNHQDKCRYAAYWSSTAQSGGLSSSTNVLLTGAAPDVTGGAPAAASAGMCQRNVEGEGDSKPQEKGGLTQEYIHIINYVIHRNKQFNCMSHGMATTSWISKILLKNNFSAVIKLSIPCFRVQFMYHSKFNCSLDRREGSLISVKRKGETKYKVKLGLCNLVTCLCEPGPILSLVFQAQLKRPETKGISPIQWLGFISKDCVFLKTCPINLKNQGNIYISSAGVWKTFRYAVISCQNLVDFNHYYDGFHDLKIAYTLHTILYLEYQEKISALVQHINQQSDDQSESNVSVIKYQDILLTAHIWADSLVSQSSFFGKVGVCLLYLPHSKYSSCQSRNKPKSIPTPRVGARRTMYSVLISNYLTLTGCADPTKAEEVALILERKKQIQFIQQFCLSPHLTNSMLLELNILLGMYSIQSSVENDCKNLSCPFSILMRIIQNSCDSFSFFSFVPLPMEATAQSFPGCFKRREEKQSNEKKMKNYNIVVCLIMNECGDRVCMKFWTSSSLHPLLALCPSFILTNSYRPRDRNPNLLGIDHLSRVSCKIQMTGCVCRSCSETLSLSPTTMYLCIQKRFLSFVSDLDSLMTNKDEQARDIRRLHADR